MATISTWANILTQVGALAATQITTMLTNWATVIGDLGNLAWTYVTKTAANIMDTIATWTNILTKVGAMSVAQITTILTSTANVISALGNWTWAQITKTASQVMTTISTWANIIAQVGNLAWANLTKTATNIMDTIASWTNILAKVGAMSVAQITTLLTNTTNVISALGNWTWAQVTKTGAQIMSTISTWTTIINQVGNLAWANLTKTAQNICDTLVSWTEMATKFGVNIATTLLTGTIQTAQMALSSFATNFFTGATGLAKFANDVLNWNKIAGGVANFFGALTDRTGWKNADIASDAAIGYSKLEAVPYKLPTSAYNYIMNPSFEYADWGGNETQNSIYVKFGEYSARISSTGSSVSSGYSNYIDVRGIDKLALATYIKITSWVSGGYFYSNMNVYTSSKTYIKHTDWFTETGVKDWTHKTLTYNRGDSAFPSNTAFIRLQFGYHTDSPDANSRAAYFDGFQVNFGDQTPIFQDFTTYSYNWTPDKLETTSTTSTSWSQTSWTDILSLQFECESVMLCFISAYAYSRVYNGTGSAQECVGMFRIIYDGTPISATIGDIGGYTRNTKYFRSPYSSHTVKIANKGTHTVKIQMCVYIPVSNATVYAFDRRLTIIKGFYQGGTT